MEYGAYVLWHNFMWLAHDAQARQGTEGVSPVCLGVRMLAHAALKCLTCTIISIMLSA